MQQQNEYIPSNYPNITCSYVNFNFYYCSFFVEKRPNRQHEPERRPEDEALCGQKLRIRNEGSEEVP